MDKVHLSDFISVFSNLMSEDGFKLYIDEPTHCSHVTGMPNSIIDLAWCNFHSDCTGVVLDYPLTDHLPIVFGFKIGIKNPKITKRFRDFSNDNVQKFDSDWPDLFSGYQCVTDNVNREVVCFDKWFKTIVNKYLPFKSKKN